MPNLPLYISLLFSLATLAAVFMFYLGTGKSKVFLAITLLWLILQGILGVKGFYTITDVMPPRFMLLAAPSMVVIALCFIIPAGRRFMDRLDMRMLTLLHTVRVLVEVVLFLLFLHQAVPRIMTFEGGNWDILSGLTAPLVYYFGFVKIQLSRGFMLAWNIICLALLVHIVVIAVLSLPLPFQRFAFSQPNIALLHFPFIWLPCCIVPLVLFSHLVVIRRLIIKGR